ncbi:hypothetical protein [Pedobacter sp. SYP-B3415]|uniref:hypothetical protein n=1 Tax=Pedobacter sp. SYP-B3415 TaxID=2496641 RepID=UPI00101C4024|nr:hypothetical protein [Pedobacter sp. SYP-B3415]
MKNSKNIPENPAASNVNAEEQKAHNYLNEESDDASLEDINGRRRNEIAGNDADYNPDLARDGSPFSDEELGPDSPVGKS